MDNETDVIFPEVGVIGERCLFTHTMTDVMGEKILLIEERFCPFGCCFNACCVPFAVKCILALSVCILTLIAILFATKFFCGRNSKEPTTEPKTIPKTTAVGTAGDQAKRDTTVCGQKATESDSGDPVKTGSYVVLLDDVI